VDVALAVAQAEHEPLARDPELRPRERATIDDHDSFAAVGL
jgi:hypothetical protein